MPPSKTQQQPVARLPFKTSPHQEIVEVGNERCGVLVFPEYHDLTVNESAWIATQAAESNTFSITSRLALKIAKLERCQPIEAHAFVAKVLAAAMGSNVEFSERENGWTVKYVRELEHTALRVVEVSIAQQNILVTAVIRNRLQGCEDWQITDTSKLPGELVEAIYSFAQKEKNHGVSMTVEDANEEVEEALGKLKQELTKMENPPTGEPSSTESDTSTQEATSSPTSDSDSSQPAT